MFIPIGHPLSNLSIQVEYVSSDSGTGSGTSVTLTVPSNPGANSLLVVVAAVSDDNSANNNNFTTITVGGASPSYFEKTVTNTNANKAHDVGYAYFLSADYPSTGSQSFVINDGPTLSGGTAIGFILLDNVNQSSVTIADSMTSSVTTSGTATRNKSTTLADNTFVIAIASVSDDSAGVGTFTVSSPCTQVEAAARVDTQDITLNLGYGFTEGVNDTLTFSEGSGTHDLIAYGYIAINPA